MKVKSLFLFSPLLAMLAFFESSGGAQEPVQQGTQVTTTGKCTINIIRSSARDVRVTGCAQQSARIAALQGTINSIFANQSVEIARIDDMIEGMNLFFAASAENQETLLAQTAESNDKLDRVIDFLESFQEKPEDAAGLIPLLSDGTLSHVQERKPFGIQLVRIVRFPNGAERIVLRLVKSGPENFDVAALVNGIGPSRNPAPGRRLQDWNIVGLFGTTCTVDRVADVTPIAIDVSRANLAQAASAKYSNTSYFPQTFIVVPICSGRVNDDDRTLNMRFYFRPEGSDGNAWEPVDFRFDASKVTKLYAAQ